MLRMIRKSFFGNDGEKYLRKKGEGRSFGIWRRGLFDKNVSSERLHAFLDFGDTCFSGINARDQTHIG